MKNKRRLFAVCLFLCLLLTTVLVPYTEAATVYYDTKTSEAVSKGIMHHTIKRFTSSGWQSIHVIEADLTDPDLQIETLTDARGNGYLNDVLDLARENNADAAVNGDFFVWASTSGQGSPVGTEIQNGEMVTSGDIEGNKATMFVDSENNVLFDVFQTEMTLVAPNGNTAKVKHFNKHDSLDGIVIYTRDWRTESLGSTNNITEVVVVDNVVEEIRKGLPPVEIPENGYVIASLNDFNMFTSDNLVVGEPVALELRLTPNYSNIQTAVGGGSMLVKDGQVAPITHNISGVNPRTAIGVNRDGTKLYLVTVDGRQAASVGMTMNEMSNLLIELGCYQGMNLDGGGSTTMVTKTAYNETLKVVNTPSDGSLRNVANGVGVKSMAPRTDEIGDLKLLPDEPYTFMNTYTRFQVVATDTNFHPYYVEQEEVAYSVSGVDGYFEKNRFYPLTSGEAQITASYQGFSKTFSYRVLSQPVYLEAETARLSGSVGQALDVKITGKDKNGYKATIPAGYIQWDSELVSVNGNQLVPKKKGAYVLCGKFQNVEIKLLLNVDQSAFLADGFEAQNGSFWSYPDYVGGDYTITDKSQKSGMTSGYLTYDFTADTEDKKAVYLLFGGNSPTLPEDAEKISLWVKPDQKNPYWLSAELTDGNGEVQRVYLKKGFDSTDWQLAEADISALVKPVKLTKLYMLQYETTEKGVGGILLDDLIFSRGDGSSIPTDVQIETVAFPDVYQNENAQGAKISFFGKTPQNATLLNLIIERKIKSTANLTAKMAFTMNPIADTEMQMNIPLYHGNYYNIYEQGNTAVIKLDASGGGLRKASTDQWSWFLNTLASSSHQNVIITLNQSLESFSDQDEAALLKKVIEEKLVGNGKTVFLVVPGSAQSVKVENGLRTLTVPGVTTGNVDQAIRAIDGMNYLEFTVSDNGVQYSWKKLFQ